MKQVFKIMVLLLVILAVSHVAHSQCAMCTEVADEASRNGNSAGDGINKGVLYLFLSPYLIAGTIGLILWRSRRKIQQELLAESQNA